MKKIVSILLSAGMCLSFAGCQSEEQAATEAVVDRSFIAGYVVGGEDDDEPEVSCRVLMNLMSDGTAEFYVGSIENGEYSSEQYSGTYSLGENEEFDETITFDYTYGETTASIENAVIIDSIFESEFYLLGDITPSKISFYETKPADMDGDVYVGYKTKVGGMGAMVYAYSLCLKEDSTFDVSIMQLASVMHVWGGTDGTYTTDGENITFTYNILTDEGEIVSENETASGTGYTENELSTAFNIQQATMRATDAPFIRVK